MSYRSDVKIIMKKRDYKRMRRGLKQLDSAAAYDKDILKWAKKEKTPCQGVILTWNYIKWDECISEAQEYIMNYLSELRTPHKFIRIGEGYRTDTDIEEFDHYETFDDMMFINQIDWTVQFTQQLLKK